MMSRFKSAIEDYRFLKNREYPNKASLKLVGDRYRLTALERNCLFRGIIADSICQKRKEKLIGPESLAGCALGVDWYNVLITVESYLKGYPVFLSDDGVLRDAAGVHGSYRTSKVTEQARDAILKRIAGLELERLGLYLDSPISFSGKMADDLREQVFRLLSIPFDVEVMPSADYPLKSFNGVVASSDSAIMDRESIQKIFDLSRFILEHNFQFTARTLSHISLSG